MQERERRRTLADFLRQQRASLSPVAVGLPSRARRRTPGLRREEVAELANIGTSWYVWLEQARDVHPSADVLDSIALALKLTLNERRHLFLLAGRQLPPHLFPVVEQVSSTLQCVLNDLNPTPAYVLGRRWDYLAWNNAAACVLSLDQLKPPHTYNLLWQFFTNPIARERHANSPNGAILTKRYYVPYNCVLILIRLHPLPKVPVGSCPHPVQILYCVPRLPLLKDAEEESDALVPLGIHGADEIPLQERPLGSDRFH